MFWKATTEPGTSSSRGSLSNVTAVLVLGKHQLGSRGFSGLRALHNKPFISLQLQVDGNQVFTILQLFEQPVGAEFVGVGPAQKGVTSKIC